MWQKKILWRLPNKNGGQDGDPGPKEVSTTMIRKTMPAPNLEAKGAQALGELQERNRIGFTNPRTKQAHVKHEPTDEEGPCLTPL